MLARGGKWRWLASTLSGVPTSSARSTKSSTSSIEASRAARSSWSESPGSARRGCSRELARLAETRGYLVLAGSASELERDLPFSVYVDALDEYLQSLEPTALAALDDDVRTELAHVFPSLSTLGSGRERRCSTSGTAATAPCRRCSSSSLRRSRSCWCSMTSTGPTRRPSSCWARCCAGRRLRLCSSRWRTVSRQTPNASRPRSSGRIARAR